MFYLTKIQTFKIFKYTLFIFVCFNLKLILNLNVFENLRIAFTSDESIKRITPKHKEIYQSFEDAPDRFIQRHSGFTVICNEIKVSSPQEYGINTVTLDNASLINGAQTQGLLKNLLEDSKNSNDTCLGLFLSLLKPIASISNLIRSFKS